ncbi:30S ribosomal protein S8 [Symmachiella macrocystis]|nr:30S ribosomal protein S8 [Symmachiella macrocystis]
MLLEVYSIMMTDPIADMLTRIRNAVSIERAFVDVPLSKEKRGIADVLQREGYIWDYEIIEQQPCSAMRIHLKYGPNGERVIQKIDRVSKPGRRVYLGVNDLPEILQGMGISVVSTNKGLLSNREAKEQLVGGEVLCSIW